MNAGHCVQLPPEQFYWAVLEARLPRGALPGIVWSRRSRLTALLYGLEHWIPVPLETVHVAFAPGEGGRTIACALGIDAVRRYLDEGAMTLSPSATPSFIDQNVDPRSINLLHGPFEAPPLRRARSRWLAGTGAAVLAITAVVAVGAERRTANNRSAEHQMAVASEAIYAQIFPAPAAGGVPSAARLLSELRSLRQTRGSSSPVVSSDAGETLARVLACWPRDVIAKTESVTVTPTSCTIATDVANHGQAQSLVAALGRINGWRTEQPHVSQTREHVHVTARLLRESPEGHNPCTFDPCRFSGLPSRCAL